MKRLGQHLLFWAVFWLWSGAIVDWHNVVTNCDKSFFSNLRYMANRLLLIIPATYFLTHYLVPKFLFERKSAYLFSFVFVIHFSMVNLLDRVFVAYVDSYGRWFSPSFWDAFFHYEAMFRNALMLIAVLGLATMIKFFKLFLKEQEHTKRLVVENLETKHAFLKTQVNPHFLFNALNNIYSMSVQSHQDKIASNISNLSGIMKYLTYESNHDMVPLEKEIQLIKDYIEIQRLRIDETDDVTIAFNLTGQIEDKFIAPVILLPLVENCFKHGIEIGEKSIISIKLNLEEEDLFFETKNYFFPNLKQPNINEKGVGLENVKKRLELIYPQSFEFDQSKIDGFYIVKLKLKMKKHD